MRSILISDGQTLLDIALQECGAVEAVFDLADANGLHITDALAPGQVLTVPASSSARPEMVGYYAARGHRVNTGTIIPAAPAPGPLGDFHHPDFNSDDFN